MALPRFSAEATGAELYEPAMRIIDQADADAHFERLVEWNMRVGGNDRAEAERIERSNLGYFAGYYSSATRHRVERLFSCAHQIFGKIAEVGEPTTEEAIQMGYDLAKRRT
jgi:hypothetical protein